MIMSEVLWKYGDITVEYSHTAERVVVSDGESTVWITDYSHIEFDDPHKRKWSSDAELSHLPNVCQFLDWWFSSGSK